jgi:hypothetical protein
MAQQFFEHSALVVWRSANDKVFRRLTPIFFEPRDIRFETTGSKNDRLASNPLAFAVARSQRRDKLTTTDF